MMFSGLSDWSQAHNEAMFTASDIELGLSGCERRMMMAIRGIVLQAFVYTNISAYTTRRYQLM